MQYSTQAQKDKDIFGIIMRAIQEKGIESVRAIIYGTSTNVANSAIGNEAIAMGMFVNSRMEKIAIQDNLCGTKKEAGAITHANVDGK